MNVFIRALIAILIGLVVIWVCDFVGFAHFISVLVGVILAVIYFFNGPDGRPA